LRFFLFFDVFTYNKIVNIILFDWSYFYDEKRIYYYNYTCFRIAIRF